MLLYGVGRTSFTPQIRRHSSAGQSARFTSVRSWVQVPLSPPKEKGTERCLFLLVQRHLAQPNAARCGGDFRFALCVVGTCGSPTHAPSLLRVFAIQTDRLPPKKAPKGAFFFWCKGIWRSQMPPSRRLTLAATLLRVLRSKQTDYPQKGHPTGCLFLLAQRHLAQPNAALATAHSRCHPFAGVAIQTDRLPQKGRPTGCLFLLVQRQGEFASLYVWYLPSLPKANSLACRSFAPAMLRQAERRSLRKVSVTVPSLASSGPE